MKKAKILIADDHQMVRKGIATLLSDTPELTIIGEAKTGREVLNFLEQNETDVVLMDITMPEMNGIEATKQISAQYDNVKVLAISMYDEYDYIQSILKAGAFGYILKDADKEELLIAIRKLLQGKNYYSDKVLAKITSKVAYERKAEEGKIAYEPTLTKRELEVIGLVAKEYTNQEIADMLNVSHRTVDTHKRNLLKKLKVKNVVGLVKYAFKHNLIEQK